MIGGSRSWRDSPAPKSTPLLADDLGSVPSTHFMRLTSSCARRIQLPRLVSKRICLHVSYTPTLCLKVLGSHRRI